MFKSRKIILFIISLLSVLLLAFTGNDFNGIIALYAIYCTGNVTQKFKKDA